MNTLLRTLLLLAAIGPASIWAQVKVDNAWARATVQGQQATGVFMQLTAPQATQLVAVSTPVAGVAEIHEMKMDAGVMKMRAMPKLDLPANQKVELKPGGYHLMLMDLKTPLTSQASVALTLTFRDAKGMQSQQQVNVPVSTSMPGMPSGGTPSPMQGHPHANHKH